MMANQQRTPQQWQQIINQQENSGLTISVFCKQRSITLSGFYLWRKRLTTPDVETSTSSPAPSSDNTQDWISFPQNQVPASPQWQIELSLPNGVILPMNQH
jgi:putative transposase